MNTRKSLALTGVIALALISTSAFAQAGYGPGGQGMMPGQNMMGGMGMMPGYGMQGGMGMMPGQGMQGGMGMMPGQGMQGGMGMMPGQGMQGGMGMMPGCGMQGGMGMMPGQGMQRGMGMMPGQGMQGGMGMMGMSPESLTDDQLDRIAAHMQSMHERLNKLAGETEPEARRALVKEHLASMQALMRERFEMMRGQSAGQGQPGNWQQHMEQRMHRMEQMMKQQPKE